MAIKNINFKANVLENDKEVITPDGTVAKANKLSIDGQISGHLSQAHAAFNIASIDVLYQEDMYFAADSVAHHAIFAIMDSGITTAVYAVNIQSNSMTFGYSNDIRLIAGEENYGKVAIMYSNAGYDNEADKEVKSKLYVVYEKTTDEVIDIAYSVISCTAGFNWHKFDVNDYTPSTWLAQGPNQYYGAEYATPVAMGKSLTTDEVTTLTNFAKTGVAEKAKNLLPNVEGTIRNSTDDLLHFGMCNPNDNGVTTKTVYSAIEGCSYSIRTSGCTVLIDIAGVGSAMFSIACSTGFSAVYDDGEEDYTEPYEVEDVEIKQLTTSIDIGCSINAFKGPHFGDPYYIALSRNSINGITNLSVKISVLGSYGGFDVSTTGVHDKLSQYAADDFVCYRTDGSTEIHATTADVAGALRTAQFRASAGYPSFNLYLCGSRYYGDVDYDYIPDSHTTYFMINSSTRGQNIFRLYLDNPGDDGDIIITQMGGINVSFNNAFFGRVDQGCVSFRLYYNFETDEIVDVTILNPETWQSQYDMAYSDYTITRWNADYHAAEEDGGYAHKSQYYEMSFDSPLYNLNTLTKTQTYYLATFGKLQLTSAEQNNLATFAKLGLTSAQQNNLKTFAVGGTYEVNLTCIQDDGEPYIYPESVSLPVGGYSVLAWNGEGGYQCSGFLVVRNEREDNYAMIYDGITIDYRRGELFINDQNGLLKDALQEITVQLRRIY